MSDHKNPHKIDLFDAALSAYGKVDPRPGLEIRILGSLKERLHRRFVFRILAVATAGATGLGVLLFFMLPSRVSERERTITAGQKAQQDTVSNTLAAVPVVPVVAVARKPEIARARIVAAEPAAPRQTTFPEPSEPSDQELALTFL